MELLYFVGGDIFKDVLLVDDNCAINIINIVM